MISSMPVKNRNTISIIISRLTRNLPMILIIFMVCMSRGSAQTSDTDSLVYEDMQYVKKRINLMLYRLNALNKGLSKDQDSIFALSHQTINKLEAVGNLMREEHKITRDSLVHKADNLQDAVSSINRKFTRTSIIHMIIHGLCLAVLILLLIYLRAEKRKSLQYLISKADNLSGRQDEILEKAGELESIRKDLRKTRKQQSKIRKKIKKGK